MAEYDEVARVYKQRPEPKKGGSSFFTFIGWAFVAVIVLAAIGS